jgi:hypothetical protein
MYFLVEACQQFWLLDGDEVYRQFALANHAIQPSPLPPIAGRYAYASRTRLNPLRGWGTLSRQLHTESLRVTHVPVGYR